MKTLEPLTTGFSRWLDLVADGVVSLFGLFRKQRTVRMQEREHDCFSLCAAEGGPSADPSGDTLRIENGSFVQRPSLQIETALQGNHLELEVRADRFVFRPLELPSRAVEFLGGVVRAQIDRLTPWSADQATFGYSAPTEASPGRIVITVAATAKSRLTPIVTAFSGLGARSITIRTAAPDAPAAGSAITILEQHVARALDVSFIRRALVAGLAGTLFIAIASGVAGTVIGGNLQAHQDDLARRIAHQRAARLSTLNNSMDPKTAAKRALAQRKNESPSDVIALEILSQILPDTTYVTEMHIEGNKLRLTGVTNDAPELIRLLEQTRHFSQASFFAPLTRAPSGPGDRFNIEARMEPDFSLSP